MPSRSNIAHAALRGCTLWEKNKMGVMIQTLAADLAMDEAMPMVVMLDGAADRDIDLPAEAIGLQYWIGNTGNANEVLTVYEDAGTTVIANVYPGQIVHFLCDGTTWFVVGGTPKAGGNPVLIPDAATYTVLPSNTGLVHVFPMLFCIPVFSIHHQPSFFF